MSDISYSNLYEGLLTLDANTGQPPVTRMADATQVRDMVVRAIRYDMTTRDWKRSRIKGLVDGNPPYQHNSLIAAGRGDECNVNWRIAKYFVSLAKGMLYDVISEEETFATVEYDTDRILWEMRKEMGLGGGSQDQVEEWSRIVTEEFDRVQREDPDWDWNIQQSQGQCVLYGSGPLVFEDQLDWRPWAFESRTLLVPEWARSNTNKWEWATLVVEYSPDKLYQMIVDPSSAQSLGVNVPALRRAIMRAHPLTRTGVMYQNWSWHQDLLKNGTYYYADQSKMIRCAHFYFREFPEKGEEEGKITECMIDLDGMDNAEKGGQVEYLFQKHKRYDNWRQLCHPMYWDHDVNGYHHSVTGLGIEMYAALEYENRLLCRLADDAFAPKLFFKPTTASEREKMSIAQLGRYAVLPAALEMVQGHVQPMLQEGIAMSREIQGLVSSNLSQFRTNALTKQQGNPVTARQIDYEASEQAKMGKTQLQRIYTQWDWVYQEKFKRITNPDLTKDVRGGAQAQDFIERCKRRGVPEAVLRKPAKVQASRVVGQGSNFMRQQSLEFLLGLMAMLPESGRSALIRDVIASRAGQDKVNKYAPQAQKESANMAEQQAGAMLQVAAMKTGVPPVTAPTQNPMVYASTFTQASEAAAQAIQQGGDPHESLAFLDLSIPAAQAHLQRMAQDKTRAQVVKDLGQRLGAVEQFAGQVKGQLAQAQPEQPNGQVDPVEMAKVQGKLQIDHMKAQGHLQLQAQKQQATLALQNQRQQAEMNLQGQRHRAEINMQSQRHQSDLALNHRQHLVDTQIQDAEAAAGIRQDHAMAQAKMRNQELLARAQAEAAKAKARNGAKPVNK